MYTELEGSLVRIFASTGLNDTKSVVGAGFLVFSDVVLTCAHVVTAALNLPDEASEKPTDAIFLDFPIVKANKLLTAHACFWQPVTLNGSGDICVLKLDSTPPNGVKEARLVVAEKLWGHQFGAIGFPDYYHRDGISISGELRTRQATGWVQIEGIRAQGFQVQQGFSGGAVWDEQLDGMVGMVVAAEMDPTSKVGYMIPADVLINAYLPLREQAIPACPYRGLFAFREEDAAYFFGRETFTQQLADTIRRKTLVAVVGSSGSGKSSVVFAGLLPRLRKEGSWQIATCRPGNDPFHSLATALIPLLEPHMSGTDRLIEINKLARRLQQGELVFEDVVGLIVQSHAAARLLLVVDQFEELYTECKDARERQRFLDLLLASVEATTHRSRRNFNLVLTLRADFLEQALTYRPLNDALQLADLKLGPMNRAELEDAIRKPAEKLQVRFADGLVQRILDDVGQEAGNLPLLEFALTLLWSKQHERTLTHAAYDEIGGVEMALADHAEAKFLEFNEEEQIQVGNIFRRLVHPGEGTGDTRRIATRTEIGEENWPLVARLANERLVITSRDKATEQEMVEVIHEALIRRWQRFRDWIEEDRQFLTWRDQLQAALRRWKNSGNDEGALLRGRLLGEAQDWKIQRPEALTEDEQAFIQASQQSEQANLLREKERADHLQKLLEEAERQRLEAERQRQLAEEQRQETERQWHIAEQHRREAEAQREEAKRQQQIALARSLAAQAELLRNQYPHLLERSVLLAIEAMRHFPGFEAHQTLQHGLDMLPRRLASLQHEDGVRAVAFSPNGQLLATASDDRTVGVWEVSSGSRVTTFSHQERARAVAFSPDGQLLATASEDKTVCIWEVSSGRQVSMLLHQGPVFRVVFSPNGRLVATASDDETAGMWEVSSGRRLATFSHQDKVMAVAFSPDGQLLATASMDGTAAVWEVRSGRQVATLSHRSGIWKVAFSPDGQLLALGCSDDSAVVCEVSSGRRIAVLTHELSVTDVAFSPDGQLLATASLDNSARVWEVSNGRQVAILSHLAHAWSVAFSPNGRLLATASIDRTAGMWEVSSGRRISVLSHQERVLAVAFSPDGQLLATASLDGTAGVWEVSSGRHGTILSHQERVRAVAFSPDGQLLATASEDKTVGVWEVSSGRQVTMLLHQHGVSKVVFSPNGHLVATASETAGVWEVSSGRQVATFSHQAWLNDVAFNPDGRLLVTASGGPWEEGGIAEVWEVSSGRQVATFSHQEGVLAVAFSPDGRLLATAGYDRSASVWEISSGRRVAAFSHQDGVRAVAFSPDGRLLATASGGGFESIAEVLEVSSGEQVVTFSHQDDVAAVAFSPDGQLLATASRDKTIGVWKVQGGQLIMSLGYDDVVSDVAFSPDGKYLAAVSGNAAWVSLWRSEDLIAEAQRRLNRNLTEEEWRQYLGDEPYRKTCPDLP